MGVGVIIGASRYGARSQITQKLGIWIGIIHSTLPYVSSSLRDDIAIDCNYANDIGCDEEDQLETEKNAETERLRVLGLERARREEEMRIRR